MIHKPNYALIDHNEISRMWRTDWQLLQKVQIRTNRPNSDLLGSTAIPGQSI